MFASTGPIINFGEDLLGYEVFARTLALGIANRTNISEPYVVGIDASWGMGKTSAVNLVQKALEEFSVQNPSDTSRVHVHHFSPWLFTNFDALALTYIAELTGALDKSLGHRLGTDWKKQRNKLLKRYGRLISTTAGAVAEISVPGLGAVANKIGQILTEVAQESTEEIGRYLRDRLAKLDAGQLVIIIDDLDRLHPDEMRNILSLIMTFGNLPRVTHIILYDRRIVDEAVKNSLGHGVGGGPTYLEKIVQLPSALPATDPILLRDFFLLRMKACNTKIREAEEIELQELWRQSLSGILSSPRDIGRVANSLAATWPAISDHAEFPEFVGIETLRIVKPPVWSALRDRRRELTGDPDPNLLSPWNTPAAAELVGGEVSAVKLVEWLFPLTSKNSREQRRGQRSISSPVSVDVYFRFQPGAVVAKSHTDALLQLANWRDLADALSSVTDRRELRSILSDLADAPEFQHLTPEDCFLAIVECADDVIEGAFPSPPALHDVEVFRDIDELLWNTFARIPEHRRAEVFRRAADQSASVSMVAVVWQRICLRGGFLQYKTSRPEVLLPEDEAIRLGSVVAARLRREAEGLRLSRAPMLGWVLRIWKDTGATDGLQNTTAQLLDTDWGLLNIVDGLMGHAVSSSEGAYRSLHRDTSIPGYDLEIIRRAAGKAMATNNIPPEVATIGRNLLEAFVNTEDWEREPLAKQ